MSVEVKEIEALFKSRKGLDEQIGKIDAKIRDLKNSVIEKIVKDIKVSNEYKNYVKASNDLLNRERKSITKTFTVVFHLSRVNYDSNNPMESEYETEVDSLHLGNKLILGNDFNHFCREINQDYFCNEALHLIPNLSKKVKKLNDLPELGYDAIDESIESLLAFKEFNSALATKLKLVVEVECKENCEFNLKILNFNGTKVGKKLISQNINPEAFAVFFTNDKDDDSYDKLFEAKSKAWRTLSNKIDKSVEPYETYIGTYVVNDRIRADIANEIKAK